MSTELEFKVESFRKIPNPYKDDGPNVSQMYTAICDVKEVPAELLDWMETNPRKQNTRSGVAKKIKESLLSGQDFHLMNRGILISAEDVRFNNYDNKCRILLSDPNYHGNVDGGHTLRVIIENRDLVDPGKQYVRLEILTGVEGIFEDLAAARNTSTQVQDKSIANLRDYFDLIKDTIASEPFNDRVYFMENDEGDIDVAEILAILNLFNIDAYQGMDSFPVVSFSSKKKCVDYYIKLYERMERHEITPDENPFVKMKPIMIQIFKLYDRLERNMADYYSQKNPGGKYGSTKGVTPHPDNGFFKSKFYQENMRHMSPNGFIYPILGAFRALVREVDGKYEFTKNPFEILDRVGPELVVTTVERSRTLGNNPVQVGKDSGNWKTLYMRVMFEAISMANN